ncbi:ATP-grasp domain-containing protein [Massilia yuzhufengensis]|uniref:Carbamoylphosphate synthase large subunit n=1 Tax=Massilia yuzhufengensis TaxID=1164594 RepID=A0A1I1WAA8_9BURK|nr:ATP-grasp domain-containing protein [Massilia yuzhufengensis]SFD90333.1 Carbamoylphosphate synthase large subunit [Massilia yuzhufengensis]
MRVWFNRTFSSVYTALRLIRAADTAQRFTIIHSNANRHTPAARLAHEFHSEPTGLEPAAYVDWCLDFCREQRIDIFVPGREATTLAAHHARFEAIGTRVLSAATPSRLHLIHDKAAFYAETALPQAPVAEFRRFENLDQFDAAWAELRPRHARLCLKPSRGIYGIGFAVIDEERSSAALLLAGAEYHIGYQDLRRGLAEMGEFRTMLLMEFLEGAEYSVDCVGDRGRLVAAVPRRKLSQAGSGQLIDARADILEATATLAADYGLNGIFNVQFRESGPKDARRLRLLEINPRMSGGIGMACAAGPNLPWIALKGFADGFDTVDVAPVRDGMRVAELAEAVELP